MSLNSIFQWAARWVWRPLSAALVAVQLWVWRPLAAALVAVQRWATRRARHLWLGARIPGPTALPLVGNALSFVPADSEVFQNFFDDTWKVFGSLFRIYIGPLLVTVSGNREDHELVLSANDYPNKGIMYTFLKSWLGNGLLISTGEKWRSRRKTLTPAFHFKILDQFIPVFNSCSDEFIRQLRKRADGTAFDIWMPVKLLTLDVICETTMGVRMNAQTNATSDYVNAVKEMSSIVYEITLRPWLYLNFILRHSEIGRRQKRCLDILHGTTDQVIRERKAELQKLNEESVTLDVDELGRRRRVAFLDLLLLRARDGGLSDLDIREEVDTFMFEGHDTTASAISFAIFQISRHPDVQSKLLEELESVFSVSEPLQPTLQQLSELKYLEMVIKETMRIFPPVAAVARDITSDLTLASRPLTIPGGSNLFMSFYLLHRNPEVFPDPERFDPERFAPEEVARRHPFAYLPFSAGSRNCIGQRFAMLEMKCVLAKIVWNYRILPVPDFEPVVLWEIVMKSKNGLLVQLEERRPQI